MADEIEKRLLEQVMKQSETIENVNVVKATDKQDITNLSDLSTELESINYDFANISYVCGWVPTTKDAQLFDFCRMYFNDRISKWPHLKRWYANIQSFPESERNLFPRPKGCSTALAERVQRLTTRCPFDSNMLDEKFNNQH